MSDTGVVGLSLEEYTKIEDDGDAMDFEEELVELFADSEEAVPIIESDGEVGWAATLMMAARAYEGLYLPHMGPDELRHVLLHTFPRKVSCDPSTAAEIVAEVRAFYAFLGRVFHLPQAPDCLAVLTGDLTRAMERGLANPDSYGSAKSFVMGKLFAFIEMLAPAPARSRPPSITIVVMDEPETEPSPRRLPASRNGHHKRKAHRHAERAARRKNR